MKSLVQSLNESLNEGLMDKAKQFCQNVREKIFKKINKMENPFLLVDAGGHWIRFSEDNGAPVIEYAIEPGKIATDKILDYLKMNVKCAKLKNQMETDTELFELVGMSNEDALELYNTLHEIFKDELLKQGITKITDNEFELKHHVMHYEINGETKATVPEPFNENGENTIMYIYPTLALEIIK